MIRIGKVSKNGTKRWQASVLGIDYDAKVTVPISEDYPTSKRAQAALQRKAEKLYGHQVKDPPPLPKKLGIHLLRIDDLVDNVVQPEIRTTDKALFELRASIACYGPQGVVIVNREDDQWVLVDGHRTARAAKQAGYEHIWAVELWGEMANDSVVAFGKLNDKQRPINGMEWLTVWAKAPISKRGSVLDEAATQRKNILLLVQAVGVHRAQQLGREGRTSPGVASTAKMVIESMNRVLKASKRDFPIPTLGQVVEYMLVRDNPQAPVRTAVEQVEGNKYGGDKVVWMRAFTATIVHMLPWAPVLADAKERTRRSRLK